MCCSKGFLFILSAWNRLGHLMWHSLGLPFHFLQNTGSLNEIFLGMYVVRAYACACVITKFTIKWQKIVESCHIIEGENVIKLTFAPVILRSVHMERFAYVCKFCIYAKFAYVCKSLHVYAFTHVCKICTYAKVGKFAPASDQVQISFCVYANFAYMQIWSCERKAKFAHVSIYLIVLNDLEMTLFQDCNYLVNNLI